MIRVVGVRFKKAGKVYYFDPAEYPIGAGAKVVVETARGVEYGEVAVGPKEVADDQVVQPLKKVLRVGTDKDAVIATENKRKENEAFGIAQKKIEVHGLDMNLVDVEYTFDGSKVIFYFTAEGRIDFRELVRDLASVFRTRIEMRQIGVRDEAKLLGGIGPCGRVLCCTSFLGDFAPVSIRMAKDQNLSLNPSKISGLCGRLMCCLRYEQDTYEAAKKDPTLAPGYVPPVMLEEAVPNLDELEDRPPTPAIGIRLPNRETGGMSARIAQAAGVAERPQRREERPAEPRRERPAPVGRPQGQPVSKALPGEKLQGEKLQGERLQGDRQQGQATEPRRDRAPQGQPSRPQQAGNQPQGDRRGGQPRRERPAQAQQPRPQQAGGQPQGERQRQQGQPQGRNPERQPRPNQAPPQGARAQGGAEPAEGGNKEQQRSRNHRHRRRGGGGGQGGQNPQGGGNPPA